MMKTLVQSNVSGSNVFGAMEMYSRRGRFESLRVDYEYSVRLGGKWNNLGMSFLIFYKMMVC